MVVHPFTYLDSIFVFSSSSFRLDLALLSLSYFYSSLSLYVQATSSFNGMDNKAKIVDVNDAFGAANTMSVGDVFGKNPKKKTRKALIRHRTLLRRGQDHLLV